MNVRVIQCSDRPFGATAAGEPVRLWTIDDGDIAVDVLSMGGIIHSLRVPDANGRRDDIVLGFDEVSGYEGSRTYAGALIGRFANRLAGGRFTLDGVEYEISTNEGPTTLHGGLEGFHSRVWSVRPHTDETGASGLRLELVSPDGDQGFPGRLEVTVDYLLVPGERRLRIDYRAVTDAPTVVNLTQHAYFNLAGAVPETNGSPVLDGHELQVLADHYTPVDGIGVPSGEIAHTKGTSFDLREPRPLDFLGLDHNLVVGDGRPVPEGEPLRLAAVLEHSKTGRRLEVHSSEPGIQVYTSIGMDGSDVGKGGIVYQRGAAVCLETQHFPDSPNRPAFPSTVLRPGEVFTSRNEWRFGTVDPNA